MFIFRFLYRLCWEKFGWATQKADELLVPVLKEYDKHEVRSLCTSSLPSPLHMRAHTQTVSSLPSPKIKSKLFGAYNLSNLYLVGYQTSWVMISIIFLILKNNADDIRYLFDEDSIAVGSILHFQ